MRRSLAIALACACFGGATALARTALTAEPPPGALAVAGRAAAGRTAYKDLSEPERTAYVEQRLRNVAAALAPGRPVAVTPDAVAVVRRELDQYAARSTGAARGATLEVVLSRGAKAAPSINRAFREAGLPVAVGLYIAMIESEFNECAEAPSGAKGMFQFLPSTAEKYGLEPDRMCDLDASAKAAAAYINDRRKEFGADGFGTAVSVLSYTLGTRAARAALAEPLAAASEKERGRALWAALASPERSLKAPADSEGARYLPRFFAAAIAGENPADFGLDQPPLSSF